MLAEKEISTPDDNESADHETAQAEMVSLSATYQSQQQNHCDPLDQTAVFHYHKTQKDAQQEMDRRVQPLVRSSYFPQGKE